MTTKVRPAARIEARTCSGRVPEPITAGIRGRVREIFFFDPHGERQDVQIELHRTSPSELDWEIRVETWFLSLGWPQLWQVPCPMQDMRGPWFVYRSYCLVSESVFKDMEAALSIR